MTAPQNTTRFDPYKNYRFKVKWDGRYVAGVSKVSELHLGRDPQEPSMCRAITLELGVTHDVAFEEWANWVFDHAEPVFRKDIVIELYNGLGQKVIAYKIYHCWVSEFVAAPELDGMGNTIAIDTLKLENEGWERDQSVTEPTDAAKSTPQSIPV
jgi:hypothetical protein